MHIEYPRMLHQWPERHCLVHSDEEKAQKLAEGWSMLPVLEEPKAPEPEPTPVAEPPPAPRRRKGVH